MRNIFLFAIISAMFNAGLCANLIDRVYYSSVDQAELSYLAYVPENLNKYYSLLVWLPAGNPPEDIRWKSAKEFEEEGLLDYARPDIAILFFEPRTLPTGGKNTFYVDTPFSPTGESDVLDSIEEFSSFLLEIVGNSPIEVFLSGGSMGGMGAIDIALRNPGKFRGVYAFAPPADMAFEYAFIKEAYDEGEMPWAKQLLDDMDYVFGGGPNESYESDLAYWRVNSMELIKDYPLDKCVGMWSFMRVSQTLSIFVVHGQRDQLVPIENNFFELLKELDKIGQGPCLRYSVSDIKEARHDESVVSRLGLLSFIREKRNILYW